jgi:hypothetical protein
MKHLFLLLFTAITFYTRAQDSAKVLQHEIGFNTVSLIKQMISNNPSSALPQLPYDIFYNLYYKDLVGIRLGLGYQNSHQETDIEGQQTPRNTDQSSLNLRAGASYNFVRTKRLTFNVFADYVMERQSLKTSNTSTIQSFPNPIANFTVENTETTTGNGGQLGVGVKYNLFKNLSLYAEVPFTFIARATKSELSVTDDGLREVTSTSGKSSFTSVTLPTTVYLVLRF